MKQNLVDKKIDWQPILAQLVPTQTVPKYPGDLKTALLSFAQLEQHPKGEQVYQLAVEIARLTTCCDPEIIYWFSRLLPLLDSPSGNENIQNP